MYRTIALFFLLCSLNVLLLSPICGAFQVSDCGSKVGKFSTVSLAGCDMDKEVCNLIRGTNATIEIDFTVEKEIKSVNAVVHGIIMDVPIPFPLTNANACETFDSGVSCPLAKDTTSHYRNTLPVLHSYPKLSLIVKWELKDENNEDIVCMLIPARLK